MLFLTGLLTLVGFIGLAMLRDTFVLRKGEPTTSKGIQFELQLDKHHKKKILMAVATNTSLQFSLKRETALDRFAKRIGLSSEIQAGAKKFDDSLYVVSDDPRVNEMLQQSSDIANSASSIVGTIQRTGCKIKEFRCFKGRLWIQCGSAFGIDEFVQGRLVSEVVPKLELIARALDKVTDLNALKDIDSYYLRAKILSSIALGMALNGIFHIWWPNQELPIQLIDRTGLFWTSIVVGSVITLVLAVIIVILLRPSSRTHIVLFEMLLVGTLGACTSSYTILSAVNQEWGEQANSKHVVEVLEQVHPRRSGYLLAVNDWTGSYTDRKIKVHYEFFSRVKKGDKLIIFLRHGYLGWEWIEDILVQPTDQSGQ